MPSTLHLGLLDDIAPGYMLYNINEFVVDSDFELPVDTFYQSPCTILNKDIVAVRRRSLADLPCVLRKVRRQLCYDVGDGVLIEPRTEQGHGIAIHVNHRGTAITVDAAEAELKAAGLWVIHVGLSAATLFRGDLTLHGSGLEIDGHFVSIMAQSGTGKSTLTHYLIQQGARFCCDDVVPVRNHDGNLIAFPSISLYPKLHRDAAERAGLDLSQLLPTIDSSEAAREYWIPLSAAQRSVDPSPLSAMFVLRPNRDAHEPALTAGVVVERQNQAVAEQTILENLQGEWAVGKVLKRERLRAWARTLADRVPLFEIRYRRTVDVLPDLEHAIRTSVALETIGAATRHDKLGYES